MSMNQRALEHKWHFPEPTLAALAQMSIDLGVKVNRLGDLDYPFLKIAHYGGYLEVGNIES